MIIKKNYDPRRFASFSWSRTAKEHPKRALALQLAKDTQAEPGDWPVGSACGWMFLSCVSARKASKSTTMIILKIVVPPAPRAQLRIIWGCRPIIFFWWGNPSDNFFSALKSKIEFRFSSGFFNKSKIEFRFEIYTTNSQKKMCHFLFIF